MEDKQVKHKAYSDELILTKEVYELECVQTANRNRYTVNSG